MREVVARFAERGDASALLFPDRPPLSYAELARRVADFARRLGPPGRLMALEARTSEHAIVAWLAALSAGHAVALLPPDDPDAFAAFSADFAPELEYRCHGGRWRLVDAGTGAGPAPHPDLALLLATSGSTGRRKYVRLSDAAIGANAAAIADYLGLTSADRGALHLPLHYSYGLSVLHSHLAAGASALLPSKTIRDPGFLDEVRTAGVTNLAGVPYSYELYETIGLRQAVLPALRLMTVAGGRLAPDLVRLYHDHLRAAGRQLFVMYGQTEAAPRIAYVPPERLATCLDGIGVAIPGGALSLRGDDGRPIDAADTPGELVYRGRNVMMGYAETRADLARGPELSELHTGDLAVRGGDGCYRIVGRLKRMSKIAGLRIGHEALEHALAAAGVAAAVTGDDRRLVAAYTGDAPVDRVREILIRASGLSALHIRVQRLPALPRLPSGKVDYQALAPDPAVPPADDGHGTLLDAFRRAFYPRAVRTEDSFATLGGDSLLFVQLSLVLERRLGHVPDAWESLPLATLARLARRSEASPRTMDTALVVRAFAILLVVVQHATLWSIPGGAAALMILVGHGLARFQSQALFAADYRRALRPVAVNLVPYYLIALGYSVGWGVLLWPSFLLVGNFGFADPADHTMLPYLYWFVEAYLQVILIWAGLLAIPGVGRFARRDPFAFGLAMLALAMGLRFSLPYLWEIGGRQIFTIPWVLYLACFGWSIHFAGTGRQKLTLALAAAIVFPAVAYDGGNWVGSWIKYLMQLAIVLLLLYAPRVPVPRPLAALLLPVAAASYHIYLVHRLPPELLLEPLGLDMTASGMMVLAIASGLALGLATHQLQRLVLKWLARPGRSSLALKDA